jgi:hypothetical protein
MINPKTWFVMSLLSCTTQVAQAVKSNSINYEEILSATISGVVVGGIWAYIAGWARKRFFSNLTDAYVSKIKLTLLILGIVLLGSVIYNAAIDRAI